MGSLKLPPTHPGEVLLEEIMEPLGLSQYRVANSSDLKVEDAVAICPVDAFRGSAGSRTIDDAACIRCDACVEVAPGAIVREAKQLAPASVA